jgi:gluconolactonase
MRYLFAILFIAATCVRCAQPQKEVLFQSSDFTKENLFTTGIEGPCFDNNGNLYVVNFQKDGTVGLVKPNAEPELFITLPEGSIGNSIKFDSKGAMLLADYTGHNVLKVDMQTKAVSVLAHNDKFNQPNDICINRKDQLFASDPKWSDSTGMIWRIEPSGETFLVADSMGTTNGIELSPDEKTLYVNESIQRKIWAFDVDDQGNLSNKRLFAEFPDFGFDGMRCDKDGNLYACRYGKGVIVVLSPDGKIIREVSLKGKNCSNLVFGGAENKTVYVTLQDRKGMEKFENDIAGKN